MLKWVMWAWSLLKYFKISLFPHGPYNNKETSLPYFLEKRPLDWRNPLNISIFKGEGEDIVYFNPPLPQLPWYVAIKEQVRVVFNSIVAKNTTRFLRWDYTKRYHLGFCIYFPQQGSPDENLNSMRYKSIPNNPLKCCDGSRWWKFW